MSKKWVVCFLLLGLIGFRLAELRPCSLERCLEQRPGRYVVKSGKETWAEKYLRARGEKLHRHGDFVVYETGPDSLRHVLELGEAEAIAVAVQQGNQRIQQAKFPAQGTVASFECTYDERGTVVGLRRTSAPPVAPSFGSQFRLARIAHYLHPGLVGWWHGPGLSGYSNLAPRYRDFFEPIHVELHRVQRESGSSDLPLALHPFFLGKCSPSGGTELCRPKCEYRPQVSAELPPELFQPDPRKLVLIGGLRPEAERLLQARGEQVRRVGSLTVMGRPRLENLVAAAELEDLINRVSSWNNQALLSRRPGPRYEVRCGPSGDAEAVVKSGSVVQCTAQLGNCGFRSDGVRAADVVSRLYPALEQSYFELWDLPARYEPLVREVRERAERAEPLDPLRLR